MDADGSNWRQVTGVEGRDQLPGAWGDRQPVWSPDGGRLAFFGFPCDVGQSGGLCPGRLYVIKADGTGRQALTPEQRNTMLNGESLADPAWSSDGTRILFTAAVGTAQPGNALFVVSASGGAATQLTFLDGNSARCGRGVTSPQWSPDGKQIAFVGSCSEKYGRQIYVMNADGTGVTRLTGRGLRAVPCTDSGCRIIGTSGNDNLVGSEGRDYIQGGAGNDTIKALGGDDGLSGGPGNDLMDGGPGSDTLQGGSGNDVLIGGEGDDTLIGGSGVDAFAGGAGNDIINSRDGKRERVDCGAGKDMLIADKLDRANGCERILRG
jgi:Ca2+-binding RTX toxin-like protein